MVEKNKSALSSKEGVSITEITNASSIKTLKKKRKKHINAKDIVTSILNKNITALSRAITLVESTNPKHKEAANSIIKECLPHANKSIRIGITGVPGAGKSTFIEAFGKHITAEGKRIAVLAIDPSSSITKGSILGDKTRMEDLAKNGNAFIRPSASGDSLGGVAKKTRESIILCEAAGFDVIIIETLGVGQSETTAHGMVDFFLLLKLTGSGDELQGIKRGIVEMADAIAINKSDGSNLKRAELDKIKLDTALSLYQKKTSNWQTKVTLCSALKNEGIETIWKLILDYINSAISSGFFNQKRNDQNKYWLTQTIENQLKSDFFNKKKIITEFKKQLKLVETNKTTAFNAAEYLIDLNKKINLSQND